MASQAQKNLCPVSPIQSLLSCTSHGKNPISWAAAGHIHIHEIVWDSFTGAETAGQCDCKTDTNCGGWARLVMTRKTKTNVIFIFYKGKKDQRNFKIVSYTSVHLKVRRTTFWTLFQRSPDKYDFAISRERMYLPDTAGSRDLSELVLA